MDGVKGMKLPKSFYLRIALVCAELFSIGIALSYVATDQTEFDEMGGEVCTEHEPITGYCIKTEVIKIEKIDPFMMFIFIIFLSFFVGISFRTLYIQYKKAKYGFKSTW